MGHLESQEARWVEIFNKFRSIFLVKSFVFKWQLLIDDSFKKGFLGGSVVPEFSSLSAYGPQSVLCW